MFSLPLSLSVLAIVEYPPIESGLVAVASQESERACIVGAYHVAIIS